MPTLDRRVRPQVRDGAATLDLSDYRIRLGPAPVGCIALAEVLSRPKLQVTTGGGVCRGCPPAPLPAHPLPCSASAPPPPLPRFYSAPPFRACFPRTDSSARARPPARPRVRATAGCARSTVLLNTCDISAKGATSIAEAIRINVTVTKLDLNSNQISDAGATAMADALRGNEVL